MLSLSSFLNTLISYFYFYSTPYTHTHTTITPFLNTYKGKSTILGSVLPRHEKTSKAAYLFWTSTSKIGTDRLLSWDSLGTAC